jgi:hypothetical protein
MTSTRPSAETPVATGVATGSLGTGTAVDEETTLMAVPEAPEPTEQPKPAATAPAAAAAPAGAPAPAGATAPIAAALVPEKRPITTRRDPYRPIGIALAAILVALVGVAVVSSGGETPAQIGPAGATTSPDDAAAGDEDAGDEDEGDDGNGGNANSGNGNGRGNGNGNGGGNGRGNDD